MALPIRIFVVLHLLIIMITFLHQKGSHAQDLIKLQKSKLTDCKFDQIYQFGDSISDTGNCIRENLCSVDFACASLPYGMTFFQKPTGRCSDGMLMIDSIAVESGLPLLNPYIDRNANFRHGVNFAVAGATALSSEFLAEKNFVKSFKDNNSLSVQLDWMSSHFNSTCSPDCPKKLKNSLFIVGEIGNEFSIALASGKTMDEVRTLVPDVVNAIIHSVKSVIGFGATRVVIPGNFPVGCLPLILSQSVTDNSTVYDEYHCVKEWNDFIIFFNNHLKQAIDELKKEYPNVVLIYGDYYNAYLWLLQNAVTLGFDKNSLQKACCGIGGDYNFGGGKKCGEPGVQVCSDPSTYISWDGIHLTQNAYNWLAKWLINDILPQLNCQV